MSESGYQGAFNTRTGLGAFNTQLFLIRRVLAEAHTAALVQIVSCTNAGTDSAVGFVDVQPLVDQLDGTGKPVPHGQLHSLPYMRMQGGANAVILDPQPGDIGIAIFAERDISRVKANKAQAAPGSLRKFDMADGLYLGGVLNGVPTQYVQFSPSGISIISPTAVTVTAPNVTINASTSATITAPEINLDGQVNNSTAGSTISGIAVATHVHGGVASGGSNTTGPA